MAMPDDFPIVQQVFARGGWDLTTLAGAGTFTEACVMALHAKDRRWGFLKKVFPQTRWNGHSVDGALYLSDLPGQSQHVDFIVGAERPGAHIGWQPDIPRYSLSDWYAPVAGPPPTVTRLGLGWFCAIRAVRDWPQDVRDNWAWIRDHLAPEYLRVFCDLEGLAHGDPDPWRDAGCNIFDPSWPDDLRRTVDFFASYGTLLHLTVWGGKQHAPTHDDRRRAHDILVAALADRWSSVEAIEVANEYRVNRFDEADVRMAAEDLRGKIPAGLRLALSSPDLAHGDPQATAGQIQESMIRLYAGSAASEMTVHINRDRRSKWANPFNYNGLWPLPMRNNEPAGPGASAGGDITDPALILDDYVQTSRAGWTHYTPHSAWSVFNGRLPDQYRRAYDVRFIWEHHNMRAICEALRDFRRSGVVTVPAPGGGGTGTLPPYDEPWVQQVVRPAVIDLYAQAGHPLDDLYPTWIARTLYDHCAGLSKQAALDKHAAELRRALGLRS